jgi:hypothetical protein
VESNLELGEVDIAEKEAEKEVKWYEVVCRVREGLFLPSDCE